MKMFLNKLSLGSGSYKLGLNQIIVLELSLNRLGFGLVHFQS